MTQLEPRSPARKGTPSRAPLRLVFFTQSIDADDPVLGFVCEWIASLAERVEALHCLCLRAGRLPALPDSVTIHSLGKERGRSRARLAWESQRALRRLTGSGSANAILAHMAPLFAVLSYPWAMRRALPLFTWYVHRQVTPALRLAVSMSDRVLTAANDSIRIASDKVLPVGHGIPVPPETELRFDLADAPEVVAVGRITPIKQWETFVEAAALLKGSRYRFRLVGDAVLDSDVSYRRELRGLVEARGLSDTFAFEGAVPYRDVQSYYRRALCTVNTCVASSFDKSVLESMAFGKPALTSNPAFASLLEGVAPSLVFPEGDAAALAARIEDLRELGGEARRDLGLRLRDAVAREHGLGRLMDRIVELFHAELAKRPALSRTGERAPLAADAE